MQISELQALGVGPRLRASPGDSASRSGLRVTGVMERALGSWERSAGISPRLCVSLGFSFHVCKRRGPDQIRAAPSHGVPLADAANPSKHRTRVP